ncbi:PepSY-associated TM helix domain-containing protein [Edaphobacter albus]|uniref:PepSY-associated TM helix domain-containing protein n=1 Tax=Edaphobacter sp. 4G125 TaxID=2763071 RepID=UPI001647E490|nr:PepSY-associated TM helix domain-containing protein [Edaphobacter sp. 4G125]QNI37612.1 PepSY-associated TM helix domain-containing protein [Edaphobacter sp. 4G125]
MPTSIQTQPSKPAPGLRVHLRRKTAVVARWLHIYLSMGSFAIVLFFAVTGLTLNHADWFSNQEKTIHSTGQMPQEWVRPSGKTEPAKLEIVERLRSANKLHGTVSDFRIDDDQLSVSFKAPGYSADVAIDRSTGHYDLIEVRNGFVAVINDLHKGRDAGKTWIWLIDLSAILLTLVSLTGLLLLFFVYKRRTSGLILAAVGTLLCYLVYLRFVP